jgi:hypothetical protein
MEITLIERKFSADQRKAAAKSGSAMPDGSYPIENKNDLENAIRAVGRASSPAAAKAHIKKRAKALGATASLPDDWKNESLQAKYGSVLYEADGMTAKSDSFDAIRCRVQDAINAAIAAGEDMDCDGDDDSTGCCYAWIMDLFPSSVVYSMGGCLFQCDYTDDGELVTLGKPAEVEQSYTTVADDSAADEAYSGYGSLTASAETPEEGKTHQALTDRGYSTTDLKSDGSSVWSKGDSTVHVRKDGSWIHGAHMGDSADSLTVHMDGTHSESLRESGNLADRRRGICAEVQMMQEAAYDAPKGLLTLTVIKPGFSKNTTKLKNGKEARRYYPADTLKRDHKVFEGAKMFVNHQTEKESRERPEGDLRDWGASLKRVWAESDGTIKGEAAVIDPPLKAKLEELQKQGLLSDMGVSVRISAEVSEGQIDNQSAVIIESLLHGRSVDFVTTGAAGGQLEMMEGDQGAENDIDLVTEAELRQRRPDLVELIESNKGDFTRMKTLELQLKEAIEAKVTAEARAKKLQETVDTLTDQVKTLNTKIDESDVSAKKATAQAELTKMLAESKLPEQAKKRIIPQFAEATSTEGMKEAIVAEEGYIKSLGGNSRVTGMGEGHNRTTLTEAERMTNRITLLKRSGMSEKEAEIAARGR